LNPGSRKSSNQDRRKKIPKPAIRADGAMDWKPAMGKSPSQDAVIRRNIRKMHAIKRDVDLKMNIRAYEWITNIERKIQNGK
jgi:hypothetical protein